MEKITDKYGYIKLSDLIGLTHDLEPIEVWNLICNFDELAPDLMQG